MHGEMGEFGACLHFFHVCFDLAVDISAGFQGSDKLGVDIFRDIRQVAAAVGSAQHFDLIVEIGNPGFRLGDGTVICHLIHDQLVEVIRCCAGGSGGAAFLHGNEDVILFIVFQDGIQCLNIAVDLIY